MGVIICSNRDGAVLFDVKIDFHHSSLYSDQVSCIGII
jgi:hypothetical protein